MATQSRVEERVLARERRRAPPGLLVVALRFAQAKPLGAIGAGIVLLTVVVALAAPLLAPYDPYQLYLAPRFQEPTPAHLFGIDNLGRDILSRVIYGARVSLYVGILSVLLGQTAGSLVGLVSGYFGGRTDAVLQRFMDALMSFPTLVLAMAIVASLGQSLDNVVVAIAIVEIPRAARVIRSSALAVKEMQFIEAARAVGASDWRVVFLHVLPQCVAPYLIIATAGLASAILVEASLSFLGLGTPPPEPSWGAMLSGAGRDYLERAPWMAIYPGLAITVAVYGFNIFGDALRDVLDPRLRGTR